MEVGGTVCSKAKEENLLGKKSVLKLEPFVYQHFSLEKKSKRYIDRHSYTGGVFRDRLYFQKDHNTAAATEIWRI